MNDLLLNIKGVSCAAVNSGIKNNDKSLDVLTIKMLQELIVNLQTESNISICICDHQARDLLSCVDVAIVLSNCKIIAKGTPSRLVKDKNAKSAYFGDSFKFN